MVELFENPVLENLSLISSWIKTLFVKHLEKSVKTLLENLILLDFLPKGSKSVTKSKLLIASTLNLSLIISKIIVPTDSSTSPIPVLVLAILWIEVSAKFFKPDGWTRRLTELTNLSHSIELLTV